MRKIFVAGAAVLALLTSSPQVSADDDIVIFGGEFDDEAAPSAPKQVDKPAPVKELPTPPEEKPAPVQPPVETVQVQPPVEVPIQPVEQPTPPTQPVETVQVQPPVETPIQPVEQPMPPQPVETVQVQPPVETPIQPVEQPTPPQPVETTEISGDKEPVPVEPVIVVPPPVQPFQSVQEPPIVEPAPQPTIRQPRRVSPPPSSLKLLKPRFIKLAVDDTYTYYLDKNSVQWKKMPYSSSEYIADVWVRLIEREPKSLDADMTAYGADNFNAEISLAREQGYDYPPEDLQVLRSQAYVLEHYYLRPKTNQIQFLCELEVFGRPQNTVNERAYDYRNWESLVPGSVESVIYAATIKIIGKSKASERGHMTFFDMLDEYARIALN